MNNLRFLHPHIHIASLFYFQTSKKRKMCPKQKTEFVDQLEKLVTMTFSRFKANEHLFQSFSSAFFTDTDNDSTEI